MALQVQIHGGPRDGEYVPYMGPLMRMPVLRPLTAYFVAEKDALPPASDLAFIVDEYVLRRGWDGEMFYVRNPR
jgi:hypothetical protein